jgi:epoxyqueuosine reductase
MKEAVKSVLDQYVTRYSFVPVDTYLKERLKLKKNDKYNDATKLSEFKSIIVLAIPYPSKTVPWEGKGYGVLSRYSYGIDYHIVFQNILDAIVLELKKLGLKAKGTVDTGDVDERFAGYLSRLGWFGKNQFLFIDGYGSYSYLATVLVDIPLDTEYRVIDDCGDCRMCIDACPSNALENGFDKNLCISEISQEKKDLSTKEISYFKTMIYGCDICQKVCPKNQGIDIHKYPEMEPSGIENINLAELLQMSNVEYMKKYGKNASSWKGASIIKRNALALIANQGLVQLKDEIIKSKESLKENIWYNKTADKVLDILERK